MNVRARLKKRPAQWMYEQMLLNWYADADEPLSAIKELVKQEEGGVMDWESEFVPMWHAFQLFTCSYIVRLSVARRKLAEKHAMAIVGPRGTDVSEANWKEVLRKARYTGRLQDEHVNYWAVDVPRGDLDEAEYRKQRRQARRQWYVLHQQSHDY
jgi:hypothetical protein